MKLEPGKEGTKELGAFKEGLQQAQVLGGYFAGVLQGTSKAAVGWPSSALSCLAQWKLHTGTLHRGREASLAQAAAQRPSFPESLA